MLILGVSCVVLGSKPKKRPPSLPWHQAILLSKIFLLEVAISILYSLTFVSDLILSGVLPGGSIYGSLILVDCISFFAWLFSVLLIVRERSNIFYAFPHGVTLVVFWILNALWLCMGVISWYSPLWWWRMRTAQDVAHLATFAVRSVLITALLLAGVLRPLCSKQSQYRLLLNTDGRSPLSIQSQSREDQSKAGSFVRKSSQGSTFSNILRKCRLLFPYIWPKGHPLLQLRVVICFLILAGGRVINLYVPIYYKNIVNALTPNSTQPVEHLDAVFGFTVGQSGVTFPLASIIIYVFLRFLQGGSVGSMGFCNNLRTFLWINVQQYTSRAMQVQVHNTNLPL